MRDVSDVDAFVECQVPASIPLYRLVHFQVERPARDGQDLPPVLREGKVLSAVYRVGPYKTSTGTPSGYALRLLVEPKTQVAARRERHALARRELNRSGGALTGGRLYTHRGASASIAPARTTDT